MRKHYIEEKVNNFLEKFECEWWKLYNSDELVKNLLRQSSSYNRLLRQDTLLDKKKSGALSNYAQS